MREISTKILKYNGIINLTRLNQSGSDQFNKLRFKVKWDEKYIDGISKISGLRCNTVPIEHKERIAPYSDGKTRTITRYEPLILERPLTDDREFETWARETMHFDFIDFRLLSQPPSLIRLLAKAPSFFRSLGKGLVGKKSRSSSDNFRKNVTLEIYNDSGVFQTKYIIYKCWVSEYQALAQIESVSKAPATEYIKLENEGWRRETKTEIS